MSLEDEIGMESEDESEEEEEDNFDTNILGIDSNIWSHVILVFLNLLETINIFHVNKSFYILACVSLKDRKVKANYILERIFKQQPAEVFFKKLVEWNCFDRAVYGHLMRYGIRMHYFEVLRHLIDNDPLCSIREWVLDIIEVMIALIDKGERRKLENDGEEDQDDIDLFNGYLLLLDQYDDDVDWEDFLTPESFEITCTSPSIMDFIETNLKCHGHESFNYPYEDFFWRACRNASPNTIEYICSRNEIVKLIKSRRVNIFYEGFKFTVKKVKGDCISSLPHMTGLYTRYTMNFGDLSHSHQVVKTSDTQRKILANLLQHIDENNINLLFKESIKKDQDQFTCCAILRYLVFATPNRSSLFYRNALPQKFKITISYDSFLFLTFQEFFDLLSAQSFFELGRRKKTTTTSLVPRWKRRKRRKGKKKNGDEEVEKEETLVCANYYYSDVIGRSKQIVELLDLIVKYQDKCETPINTMGNKNFKNLQMASKNGNYDLVCFLLSKLEDSKTMMTEKVYLDIITSASCMGIDLDIIEKTEASILDSLNLEHRSVYPKIVDALLPLDFDGKTKLKCIHTAKKRVEEIVKQRSFYNKEELKDITSIQQLLDLYIQKIEQTM